MKHNVKKLLPESIIDSLAIFVSLYMFILIFFVLLNTVVRNNQSSNDNVYESLTKTFNNDNLKSVQEIPGNIKLDNIKDKIKNHIPVYAKILPTESYNNNHVIRILLKHKDFFSKNPDIQTTNQEFLSYISELSGSKYNEQSLFLTVIFNYNNLANKNDFIKEFTSFYNNFRSMNLNNKNYKVGLNQSDNDNLVFNIYLE